jgi:LPS-assembly protein
MRILQLFALFLLALPLSLKAQNLPVTDMLNSLTENINIEGYETSFDPTTGIASAKGNVHIIYGDTEILCGQASYNSSTGDIIANQAVTVVKAGVTYQGENLVYNAKTGDLSGAEVRSGIQQKGGQLLYTLDKFQTETKFIDRIDGENAVFTTHDLANPNYKVKAKKLTIYPDDRVVMKNIKVYAGDTPVFWLPYLSQPMDDEVGYTFSPGYTKQWGAYLLNQYGVIHGDHTLAKYHLDLRSSRGIAAGVDLISMAQRTNDQWGRLKFYYANDSDPLSSQARENRTADDVSENRYRVNFQHRIYITGPSERTWYVDFDINKMSDEFFYEDYFFEDFRSNREPDNQVSLVRSDPRYTATLMAKFQLNDYYRTDTRLPELAFDFTRQPIFNTGLFYQGYTSYGIMKEKLGTRERNQAQTLLRQGDDLLSAIDLSETDGVEVAGSDFDLPGFRRAAGIEPGSQLGRDDVERALNALQIQFQDRAYNRLSSYHEVLFPKTLFGWLNIAPRLGGGVNQYSSIEGGPKGLDSDTQSIFHAGMDVSFKFSRTWDDVQSKTFGLNGLKHTVQPYVNWSLLETSEVEGLPKIDRLVPTTRPRPLDIPLYTAVDDLRDWNVTRVGVRNLLQTKRDYTSVENDNYRLSNKDAVQTYNWMGLNTYMDIYGKDPEFDRSTGNLYNEIFFNPARWLSIWADTQLPVGGSDANFTEVNHGFTVMPTDSLQLSFGHQLRSDHPFFDDSSLVYSRIYARLNENWGLSMNHVYEIDDATLEYQSYTLHRDLSSWVASIGALVRDNRGATDFGVIFALTLKDFPSVSMPLDVDPNPSGRGGRR